MTNYTQAQGSISAQRYLTEDESDIILLAVDLSGNDWILDLDQLESGVIKPSEDSIADYGLRPATLSPKKNVASSKDTVNFAEFIRSLLTLDGLGGLRWSGEFVLATDTGFIPDISKVIVKGKSVTRHAGSVVFEEKGKKVTA